MSTQCTSVKNLFANKIQPSRLRAREASIEVLYFSIHLDSVSALKTGLEYAGTALKLAMVLYEGHTPGILSPGGQSPRTWASNWSFSASTSFGQSFYRLQLVLLCQS